MTMWIALIGRLFATGAYYVCLQYASELFPTSIRGAGLSACEVFGGVGLLISPWIVYLVGFLENRCLCQYNFATHMVRI